MIGIMVIAVGCATSGTDTATTPQEESVESAVRELSALTEVANERIAATQTVQAALNVAVTATASFESTVNAELAQVLRATAILKRWKSSPSC
jgi:hypothetical protein